MINKVVIKSVEGFIDFLYFKYQYKIFLRKLENLRMKNNSNFHVKNDPSYLEPLRILWIQ